jgi:hypothetical protein
MKEGKCTVLRAVTEKLRKAVTSDGWLNGSEGVKGEGVKGEEQDRIRGLLRGTPAG